MAAKIKPLAIGIDLGSSNTCVTYWKNKKIEIIPNDVGERSTPSYISFAKDNSTVIIGRKAKNAAHRYPENTIFNITRLLGKKYNQDDTIKMHINSLPFNIIKGNNNDILIDVIYNHVQQQFSVEKILIIYLRYIQKCIQKYTKTKNNHNAVISIPSFYGQLQTAIIKRAAMGAGFNVLRIIHQSTAASFTYGIKNKNLLPELLDDQEYLALVFDLGSNTCNVSLVSIDDGVFEVKGTHGCTIGGDDFDNVLIAHFVKEFRKKYKLDCSNSKRAMLRLRKQCEIAKCTLSTAIKAYIDIDSFYNDIDLVSSITRATFEHLILQYTRDCTGVIGRVLSDARYSKSDIDDIILIGGSCRIPMIEHVLERYFDGKKVNKSMVNIDDAVASGLAVQSAILCGCDFGSDDDSNILLLDVTPLSLGVEIAGGIMTKLIERNKTIPCKASETYSTYQDNQASVIIKVYEGERQLVKDNNLLGVLQLDDIPPAPRGLPRIEVAFDLDARGVLSVSVMVILMDKKNPSNKCKKIIDALEFNSKYSIKQQNTLFNSFPINTLPANKPKDLKKKSKKKDNPINKINKSQNVNADDYKLNDNNKKKSNLLKNPINKLKQTFFGNNKPKSNPIHKQNANADDNDIKQNNNNDMQQQHVQPQNDDNQIFDSMKGKPIKAQNQNANANVNNDINAKNKCQIEFEIFLKKTIINKKNALKYLKQFEIMEYNDIRYIDDFNDEDFLKNDILMNNIDLKRFLKKIKIYQNEIKKFKKIFYNLNKNDIYYEMFESNGILTLSSFNQYIKSANHIDNIINNKNDSIILWKHIQQQIHYDNNDNDNNGGSQVEGH